MTKFVLYNTESGTMYGICDTRKEAKRARKFYNRKDHIVIREVVYLNEEFINYGEYLLKLDKKGE